MKIYTKHGDDGDTSFFGGDRASKGHPRVAAYGDVDELNAQLGAAHARMAAHPALRTEIEAVQRALFGVGGEVATPGAAAREKLRGQVTEEDVVSLERSIDRMEDDLPALTQFILPGGGPAGATLHVARTVCRRAERAVVGLEDGDPLRPEVVRYLNRLSDWLFVAARWVNHREGRPELPW
ncbi:MAG: cob(I)yrinic acid a,c-diamide adenosyltransferase [Gemmatimonadetes bacterium]|nr:cob(I)yrinic acid a,c-diamide adenosyltransferase [Gemmatimonadota bacterium]